MSDDNPRMTESGRWPGVAAAETVERYHLENKAAHAEMDERLRTVESTQAGTAEWREHLDRTLGEIQGTLKELRPQPIKAWAIVLSALPFLLLFAGWIWQASRYPERTEFERLNGAVTEMRLQVMINRHDLDDLRKLVEAHHP